MTAYPLSKTGERQLAEAEATIERGLSTFWEVGAALMAIRDGRLYRGEFGTFEDYCQQRWNMTRRRANQLVEAAQMGTMVPIQNERQGRVLAPLKEDPAEVREVYAEAERRGDTTAAGLAEVVKERKPSGVPAPQPAAGGDAPQVDSPAASPPAVPKQPRTREAAVNADLNVHRVAVAKWLAFPEHDEAIEAMTAQERTDYRSFVHSVWIHANQTLDVLDNPARLKAVQ